MVWEDGTTSWFKAARPEDLTVFYRSRLNRKLIHEATVAYAELMLTPRTAADVLKGRSAFTKIEYEKTDDEYLGLAHLK